MLDYFNNAFACGTPLQLEKLEVVCKDAHGEPMLYRYRDEHEHGPAPKTNKEERNGKD